MNKDTKEQHSLMETILKHATLDPEYKKLALASLNLKKLKTNSKLGVE